MDAIRYRARINLLYHQEMGRRLKLRNLSVMGVSIVLAGIGGTTTAMGSPAWFGWLSVASAIVASLAALAGWQRRHEAHWSIAARYMDLWRMAERGKVALEEAESIESQLLREEHSLEGRASDRVLDWAQHKVDVAEGRVSVTQS